MEKKFKPMSPQELAAVKKNIRDQAQLQLLLITGVIPGLKLSGSWYIENKDTLLKQHQLIIDGKK